MRNIFDQYSQPENRITHSLLTALNEDRALLRLFLREIIRFPASKGDKLTLVEQQYPFEPEPSEEEAERRGIPDGWIYSDKENWCIILEAKVLLAKLSVDQINRHLQIARRMGFGKIVPVAIVSKEETGFPKSAAKILTWPQIYSWMKKYSKQHDWASRVALYMEISEAKMTANNQVIPGAFTKFFGIPFNRDHPLTYVEAKRVLGLALNELRKHKGLQKKI